MNNIENIQACKNPSNNIPNGYITKPNGGNDKNHNEILKSNHKTYNEKHSDMYTWFITKSKWSDLRKRPDAYV